MKSAGCKVGSEREIKNPSLQSGIPSFFAMRGSAVHCFGGSDMAQTGSGTKRSARLGARVCRKEKDLTKAAASLRGVSTTDFLRATVTDAAQRVIRESAVLTVSTRSKRIFVEALLNPPRPNDAALAGARRFKREVG